MEGSVAAEDFPRRPAPRTSPPCFFEPVAVHNYAKADLQGPCVADSTERNLNPESGLAWQSETLKPYSHRPES